MTNALATVDKVTFEKDIRRIRGKLSDVQKKVIPTASKSALNKTGKQVLVGTRKEVAQTFNIPQKALKGRLVVLQKATTKFQWVLLSGRFSALSYSKIGTMRDTRAGVSVGRRGVVAGVGSNKTFVAVVKAPRSGSTHSGAFSRRTRKRLPIKEMKLALIPQARQIFNKQAGEPARRFFVADFETRVDAALARRGLK